MSATHSDAMVTRLEKEIEERNAAIEGIIAGAQDTERDLTATENELCVEARKRIEVCEQQLETLYETRSRVASARKRHHDLSKEMDRIRHEVDNGPVEYRSAGSFMVDAIAAHNGDRKAQERIEVFQRAAEHQTTGDNLGVIPDPIVGNVINFIDSARPLVSFIGPQALTTGTWYRPKVTQNTSVARQTDEGSPEKTEKVELASQKMTIERLTVNAETYGGYVNVSRQNIDWSSPSVFDLVVNDLAAQYAIQTEAAAAAALAATATTAVSYPLSTGSNFDGEALAGSVWNAVGEVYEATRGQGRLAIVAAPDRLKAFGKAFAPVNPRDAQSPGFTAGMFGQGIMGTISGIPVIMSSGLQEGESFLFSSSAFEVWEQRVGTLQVVEPSVLGVQVAYAGYFATLLVEAGGVVPLVEGTA